MELLPLALKQASEDDWGHLIALSTQGGDMGVSMALNLSIFCSESLPFWNIEDEVNPSKEPILNPVQNPFSHQVRPMMKKMCGVWLVMIFNHWQYAHQKATFQFCCFMVNWIQSHLLLDLVLYLSSIHKYTISLFQTNKGHNVALTDCGTNMMVDFLQKYNGTASVELIDCHQERPLRFFHTVAGHLSEEENSRGKQKKIIQKRKNNEENYGNNRRTEDTMIRADGIQKSLEVYRP